VLAADVSAVAKVFSHVVVAEVVLLRAVVMEVLVSSDHRLTQADAWVKLVLVVVLAAQ
jgi:hypothetical protein